MVVARCIRTGAKMLQDAYLTLSLKYQHVTINQIAISIDARSAYSKMKAKSEIRALDCTAGHLLKIHSQRGK